VSILIVCLIVKSLLNYVPVEIKTFLILHQMFEDNCGKSIGVVKTTACGGGSPQAAFILRGGNLVAVGVRAAEVGGPQTDVGDELLVLVGLHVAVRELGVDVTGVAVLAERDGIGGGESASAPAPVGVADVLPVVHILAALSIEVGCFIAVEVLQAVRPLWLVTSGRAP